MGPLWWISNCKHQFRFMHEYALCKERSAGVRIMATTEIYHSAPGLRHYIILVASLPLVIHNTVQWIDFCLCSVSSKIIVRAQIQNDFQKQELWEKVQVWPLIFYRHLTVTVYRCCAQVISNTDFAITLWWFLHTFEEQKLTIVCLPLFPAENTCVAIRYTITCTDWIPFSGAITSPRWKSCTVRHLNREIQQNSSGNETLEFSLIFIRNAMRQNWKNIVYM